MNVIEYKFISLSLSRLVTHFILMQFVFLWGRSPIQNCSELSLRRAVCLLSVQYIRQSLTKNRQLLRDKLSVWKDRLVDKFSSLFVFYALCRHLSLIFTFYIHTIIINISLIKIVFTKIYSQINTKKLNPDSIIFFNTKIDNLLFQTHLCI